jgi:hypothetical protein
MAFFTAPTLLNSIYQLVAKRLKGYPFKMDKYFLYAIKFYTKLMRLPYRPGFPLKPSVKQAGK